MLSAKVGSFQRAQENLGKAAEAYGRLAKKHPESLEYRLQECRAMYETARLFWDDNRKPVARQWVEKVLERLEAEYVHAPDNPAICYEIGRSLVLLGGCLPDGATRETREALANRALGLFEKLIAQKYREVDSRAGASIANYRLALAQFAPSDQQGFLHRLDRIAALDQAALELEPTSPYLNGFVVFTRWDKADALSRLGQAKESLEGHEAAVAKCREIVKGSPDVGEPSELLAEAVNKLGAAYRRLGRGAESQAAIDEANQVMDALVRRFPDRAYFASQWVGFRNELADFFEYGPKPNGEIQARQDLVRTLDQAVLRGREFAARFPDHHWLQVNFAKSLGNRGRYDTEANRNESALPYLLRSRRGLSYSRACRHRIRQAPMT